MNVLEGVQYRNVKGSPNAWLAPVYEDWQDVPEGMVKFPGKTEFRMKPKNAYILHTKKNNMNVDLSHTTLDKAISELKSYVNEGKSVTIERVETTPDIFVEMTNRNVQFNASGGDWQYFRDYRFSGYSTEVVFRIRPDYYHVVNTIDHNISGQLKFDDIEKLAKAVDNRIRTDGLDFSVTKVKYV